MQTVAKSQEKVDAVFFAGDLVNVPDRASEWFDDNRGGAFFPSMQGRASLQAKLSSGETATWKGGIILQHAPMFPCIGNHEVMGTGGFDRPLNERFGDPRPVLPTGSKGYDTTTYEQIFSLPDDGPGGERYYAIRFGDVFLVSLFATRIWRPAGLSPDRRGTFRESEKDLHKRENWGWGRFIFEDIAEGTGPADQGFKTSI
jgi:hypothetical protein